MVPAVSWYRRSRLFQEIYFCVWQYICIHCCRIPPPCPLFFFFFFSFLGPFLVLSFMCIMERWKEKKKKKSLHKTTSNVASQSPGNVPGSRNEPGFLVHGQNYCRWTIDWSQTDSGSTRKPKKKRAMNNYPKGTTLRWPATQLTQWSPPLTAHAWRYLQFPWCRICLLSPFSSFYGVHSNQWRLAVGSDPSGSFLVHTLSYIHALTY